MGGRFLLDTNIVIALLAYDPTVVHEASEATEAYVSAVTVGELYYGATRSACAQQNIARVDQLLSGSLPVISCTHETARHYATVRNDLRQKGKPIPDADLWIAAIAHQHSLTLVTRDEHFAHISQLALVRW